MRFQTENGHANDLVTVNGNAGPSRSSSVQSPPTSPTSGDTLVEFNGQDIPELPLGAANNNAVIEHLYQNGFQLGHWADTVLHIKGQAYNLHALLLGRSPYLSHLLSNTPLVQGGGSGPLRAIYVPIEYEPEITPEAFVLAIGYLYSSTAVNNITPSNARAVLASGCFLGGVDELCHVAYETCRSSISLESVNDWLQFIKRTDPREETTSGRATPTSPNSRTSPFRSPFTAYASKLREDVMHFLVAELPLHLSAFPQHGGVQDTTEDGIETLMQVYSCVPFDIFKKAIESPSLRIGSDHARFRFAKTVIERRKRPGNIAHLSNTEETVVLAFGASAGSGSSNVHVTRKVKKRPLWKVSV